MRSLGPPRSLGCAEPRIPGLRNSPRDGSRAEDFKSGIFLYSNHMGFEPSLRPGRAAARLARQVEIALAQVDLSLAQYRILILLDEGKVVASALADRLAVSRPSITAVVDGLVTRGLVVRNNDPDDRRRVGHDLTDEGRRLLGLADDTVDRRLGDIASLAGKTRAAHAFKGLASWREAMDAARYEKQAAEKHAAEKHKEAAAK